MTRLGRLNLLLPAVDVIYNGDMLGAVLFEGGHRGEFGCRETDPHGESHQSGEEAERSEKHWGRGMEKILRFADIFLAIFEIAAQFGDFETDTIGLRSHERESWLEHFVCELFVVCTHTFPEVIDNVLDRDRAYQQILA